MAFIVYILECADHSLYIGQTDDLDRRMQQHDMGSGHAYTATRRPFRLLHAEAFETRYEALAMERKLQGLEPRQEARLCPWRLGRDP